MQAGYYFCRILPGDEISPTDRGEIVGPFVPFKFRRKNNDDSFSPDSYWPNQRSCRSPCINWGASPATAMPRGVEVDFEGYKGSDPFPSALIPLGLPATLSNSDRSTTTSEWNSDIGNPPRILVEFESRGTDVIQIGAIDEWTAEGFGILVRITISNNSKARWRLVYLTTAQLSSTNPIPIANTGPVYGQVCPRRMLPLTSFTNDEVLILANDTICTVPNAPFCLVEGDTFADQSGAVYSTSTSIFWRQYEYAGKLRCWPLNLLSFGLVEHSPINYYRNWCFDLADLEVGTNIYVAFSFREIWWQRFSTDTFPGRAFRCKFRFGFASPLIQYPITVIPIGYVPGTSGRLYEAEFNSNGIPIPMVIPDAMGSANIVCAFRLEIIQIAESFVRFERTWVQAGTLLSPSFPPPQSFSLDYSEGRLQLIAGFQAFSFMQENYNSSIMGGGIQHWQADSSGPLWPNEPHLLDWELDAGVSFLPPT